MINPPLPQVLEVDLALPEGEGPPDWVVELLDSGGCFCPCPLSVFFFETCCCRWASRAWAASCTAGCSKNDCMFGLACWRGRGARPSRRQRSCLHVVHTLQFSLILFGNLNSYSF